MLDIRDCDLAGALFSSHGEHTCHSLGKRACHSSWTKVNSTDRRGAFKLGPGVQCTMRTLSNWGELYTKMQKGNHFPVDKITFLG